MSNRPPEILEIDITLGERQAFKSPDLAAYLADGWTIAYAWIKRVQAPDQQERSFVVVVLAPPVAPREWADGVAAIMTGATAMADAAESVGGAAKALDRLESGLARHQAWSMRATLIAVGAVAGLQVLVSWLFSLAG